MPPVAPQAAPRGTAKAKSNPVMLHNLELPPFVDELPLPVMLRPDASGKIEVAMREVHAKVHRDVPPTRQWVYTRSGHHDTLSPLLELRSGQETSVTWANHLPTEHFLPVDHSLHGCGRDLPEVRACVHLHGGRNRTRDDGYPDSWYAPGHSFTAHYPLEQDAATLWYHDHAMGLNRLNIYAGLFGMALVRDETEDALDLPAGKYEVPLLFYDRNFSADGQLFYPESGDPEHPWMPEFAGDAILVNGKIRPFLNVEPRLYRFRVLNAANSRFFELSLEHNLPYHQIGSDQGLLGAPVRLTHLYLAPAERADLLIDFSDAAGSNLHLLNGALPVLEFRVAASGSVKRSLPVALRDVPRTPAGSATVTRRITLNEVEDKMTNPMLMLLNYKHWHEPVTETPKLNSTEIWEFVNLTEDTHPMHLHLVRFQVLDRRLFDVFQYRNGDGIRYLAEAIAPEPNELGWKDVVQCPPGMVTRILVPFSGYAGKYLYHCHILEHEANDMMRPFEVIA